MLSRKFKEHTFYNVLNYKDEYPDLLLLDLKRNTLSLKKDSGLSIHFINSSFEGKTPVSYYKISKKGKTVLFLKCKIFQGKGAFFYFIETKPAKKDLSSVA